jgi:hypothetical protein
MRRLFTVTAMTAVLALFLSVSEAVGQYYVYPAPVVAARPVATTVYQAPVTVYRPAPVVYPAAPVVAAPTTVYRPVAAPVPYTAYRPVAAPVPYTAYQPVAAPVAYPAAPAAVFWSPYGGTEVRVPGQPVRNLLRAIVP